MTAWRAVASPRAGGMADLLPWRELVASVSTSTKCNTLTVCEAVSVEAGGTVTARRAVARDRCYFRDCYEKPLPGNDRPMCCPGFVGCCVNETE